jgi:hypothetical protein
MNHWLPVHPPHVPSTLTSTATIRDMRPPLAMNSAMVVRCLTVTFDTARFPCSKRRDGEDGAHWGRQPPPHLTPDSTHRGYGSRTKGTQQSPTAPLPPLPSLTIPATYTRGARFTPKTNGPRTSHGKPSPSLHVQTRADRCRRPYTISHGLSKIHAVEMSDVVGRSHRPTARQVT